jgi:DivIVA domain-containing protein
MRRKKQQAQSEFQAVPASSESRRITPVDIQQKEFRLAFRGYHERDVDAFLDQLTEEVARLHADNKRLREEMDFQRTSPLGGASSAAEADALIRRAREGAARIMSEARERARALEASASGAAGAAGAAPAAGGPIGSFLTREREFLQSLAGLIQGHADSVKEEVRRLRTSPGPGPAGPEPAGPPGGGGSPASEWSPEAETEGVPGEAFEPTASPVDDSPAGGEDAGSWEAESESESTEAESSEPSGSEPQESQESSEPSGSEAGETAAWVPTGGRTDEPTEVWTPPSAEWDRANESPDASVALDSPGQAEPSPATGQPMASAPRATSTDRPPPASHGGGLGDGGSRGSAGPGGLIDLTSEKGASGEGSPGEQRELAPDAADGSDLPGVRPGGGASSREVDQASRWVGSATATEPNPDPVRRGMAPPPPPAEDDGSEERSLRELFWGEN